MRKLSVRLGMCGLLAMPVAVDASHPTVIVEGSERASGTVRVSGDHVPLLQAIEQIVPTNYSVDIPNAAAWSDTPVSWPAGRSFVQVLRKIVAVEPSLQARVNTDLHVVTIVSRSVTSSTASHGPADDVPIQVEHASSAAMMNAVEQPSAMPAANLSLSPSVSVSQRPPAISSAVQANVDAAPASMATMTAQTATAHAPTPSTLPMAAPMAPSTIQAQASDWTLRPSDGSVRNALSRWASEAGWQFVWDVPTDFSIDATATIHGTLEEALHQVVDALSNAQVPIRVVMYKSNHVLRIIPKGVS